MTDELAVAVRFGLYVSLMIGFGTAAFALHAPSGTSAALPLRRLFVVSSFAGLVLSSAGLVILAAGMAGVALVDVDCETVISVLTDSAVGTSWIVRMTALGGLLIVAFLPARIAAAGAAAGGVALATLAWSGHGAADEGVVGWVHLGADVVHLAAAATWLGALVGLLLLLVRLRSLMDAAHVGLCRQALRGFSTIGTILVGTIVVTGAISGWLLVGPSGISLLGSTLYGRLLIAKLALFAAMLAFAWGNRFWLTPALEREIVEGDPAGAVSALRWSLALETGCAVAVLGLVAWLGTLEPILSS